MVCAGIGLALAAARSVNGEIAQAYHADGVERVVKDDRREGSRHWRKLQQVAVPASYARVDVGARSSRR
jgi:hypothetical protein